MTRSTKGALPQPKKAGKSPAGSGRRFTRWMYRPKVLLLTALIAAGAILLPYLSRWLPDLSQRDEYRYSTSEMRLTSPNRWAPPDLVQEVIDAAELPEEFSLLDKGIVEQVALALDAHPWIAKVAELRLSREYGIEARLEYRVPVLMVETPQGVYPVDRESVLLPPADFSVSDVKRFPLLRNVRSLPSGPAGEPWGDVVVQGAARLASELAPQQKLSVYWERFDLAAIEAPGAPDGDVPLEELTYELVTQGGSRIVWGAPPGADQLEPTVRQKLGRLEDYFATHGGFESARGPNRIDIRQFDTIEVISLQPRTPSQR